MNLSEKICIEPAEGLGKELNIAVILDFFYLFLRIDSADIRIIFAARFAPPFTWITSRAPITKWINTIHGARGQTLITTAAQFWDYHDIGAEIKNRPELWWASAKASIAIYALGHLDSDRRILPFFITLV